MRFEVYASHRSQMSGGDILDIAACARAQTSLEACQIVAETLGMERPRYPIGLVGRRTLYASGDLFRTTWCAYRVGATK